MNNAQFDSIVPVLPSSDIHRDVDWYELYTGFKPLFSDSMYAVLKRDELEIHLQWHSGTDDDPILGGSVIRIFVNDIHLLFDEFVQRETVTKNKLQMNTAWNTNEFGFYDLNNNAIFIVQKI